MKSSIKFNKVFINGKWAFSSDTKNVPYIWILKDDQYKVKMSNGRNKICKDFNEAKTVAIETWKKYKNFKLDD